jgi:pimeloyl-ACP methyl ester carboxylesterase
VTPTPTPLTMVFVHGGQHTGACWAPTLEAIRATGRDVRLLAVDLPGRRDEPGDLATLTIADCVASVVRQIDDSGAGDVMLVGHSMAGLTLPGVVTALGQRVKRAVYIACCVPPQGGTVMSTLDPPVSWIAGAMSRLMKVSPPMPRPIATFMFANGMTKEQKRQVVAGLVSESSGITRERVDRSAMPKVPTTWIVTLRDHSLRPKAQREHIANLGGVDEVLEVDTCHNIMLSEPVQLAELLVARA